MEKVEFEGVRFEGEIKAGSLEWCLLTKQNEIVKWINKQEKREGGWLNEIDKNAMKETSKTCDRMIEERNKQKGAWIKKELVDSGGKITDEGWKVLEERERDQAKGGEHDPK